MAERICSVEGCDRKHFGKSFCQMHYQRWRTHGDPLLGAAVRNPDYCTVDGCDKPKHSRGWCPMHYQRWRIYGSLDPEFPPVKSRTRRVGIDPCEIDGCENVMRARGWCVKHYTRWCRYGSPTARLRGEVVDGKRICSLCGVDKPIAEFWRDNESWCRDCFNDRQRERARARYVPVVGQASTCEHCGAEFMANKRRGVFCSPECTAVGKHRRNVKHVQARRARERAVTVEPFFPLEVYERDGWICRLCGDPIDRVAVKPHPHSRSIDHIVPIALGGEHSIRNVQAAHLGCNVRKGCRLVG